MRLAINDEIKMNFFLFQCLPENYRLVDALHDGEQEIWWRTTAHNSLIAVGDKVFLWQAQGKKPNSWGLHAIAEVIEKPRLISLSDFDAYWTTEGEKDLAAQHTRVRIVERAVRGKHLAQQLVVQAPTLINRGLFRGVMGVNFKLEPAEALVLDDLWKSHVEVGVDTSLATRPVVPNQEGKHDENARELLDNTSAKLLDRSLEELERLLKLPHRQRPPELLAIKVAGRSRDPVVAAYARVRAGNSCEIAGCDIPLFVSRSGIPFVEVHHIKPLAQSGADAIGNVACVCPSHHREAHHGRRASEIASQLQKARKNLP